MIQRSWQRFCGAEWSATEQVDRLTQLLVSGLESINQALHELSAYTYISSVLVTIYIYTKYAVPYILSLYFYFILHHNNAST